MDIIEKYLIRFKKNINNLLRKYENDPIKAWEIFQTRDAATMCVVAGRRSGKTYNVCKRAIISPNEVYIITQSKESARHLTDTLTELILDQDEEFYDVFGIMQLNRIEDEMEISLGERKIHINGVKSTPNLRGKDFSAATVIFDDPDGQYKMLEYLKSTEHPLLTESNQLIMIGSIYRGRANTPLTQFFRNAEYKQVINSYDDEISMFDKLNIELCPGRFRHMFEQELD